MVSFKILIFYFNLFLSSYTTAQLAGPSCIPEGTNVVSYECSVDDPTLNGATIWQGTALNCSTRSIVLRHSEYNTTGANDTCGSLSAASVSINRTRFTSRLTFLAIHVTELDGKMLNCTLNGTALLPGSDMIKVGVRPSPPEGINITSLLDSSGETRLIVGWSPPAQSVEGGVGGYVLNVSGDGGECGCVSMNVSADTTNVTCSGINGTGQICSFEVRAISIDCGLTSDFIMESIELLLPPPPRTPLPTTPPPTTPPPTIIDISVSYVGTFIITVTAVVIIVLLCLGVFLTGTFYRKKYKSSKESNRVSALTLEKEDYNVDNQTVFELNGASNMEAVHSLEQKKDKQLVPGMSEGSIFGEVHKPFVDKNQ